MTDNQDRDKQVRNGDDKQKWAAVAPDRPVKPSEPSAEPEVSSGDDAPAPQPSAEPEVSSGDDAPAPQPSAEPEVSSGDDAPAPQEESK